jgi:hypothetical protein
MVRPLLVAFCFLSIISRSQTNSVELKDGNGFVLGQHNSITSAIAAIPASISQSYVIELTGSYLASNEVYPITFTALTGSSPANTITLRPALGVPSLTISASISASSIIQLNDADYVIIDGRPGGSGTVNALTVANTATTSSSNTITFINGACNNVIRNCNINNGTTGNAGRGIAFSTSLSNTTGNSDNLVTYCVFTGGRYLINSNGTAANKNTRNKIYGCDIINMSFVGIWYQAGSGQLTIDSNRFYCTAATGDGPYGILFDSQTDTVIVSRNHMFNINNGALTSLVKAISVRSVTGTNYTLIHNNMISLSSQNSGSTAVYGIEYATGSGIVNAGIYYNTVRIQGTLSSGGTSGNVVSAAMIKTGTGATSIYNIYDNLFLNERTGGTAGTQHVGMAITSITGTINSDYNTYNASSGNHVRYGTTLYNTIPAYQGAVVAPNETHSNFTTAQFISVTDLHLSGSSLGDNNLQGIPIILPAPLPDINVDFDNEPRASIPYRGADESLISPLSLKLIGFSAHWNGEDATLDWSTTDEKIITFFQIERSFNSIDFAALGNIYSKPGNGVISEYRYVDNKPGNIHSKIYYRLRINESNGHYSYSPVIILNKKYSGDISIKAFPTPFQSQVNLQLFAAKECNTRLQIADALGKVVLTRETQLKKGINNIILSDLGFLSKGTYYLLIRGEQLNEVITIYK